MLVEVGIGLLGLAVGFCVGRITVGRGKDRLMRDARTAEELAYIKGVKYILSDEPDHAIEAFIKAAQVNSDNVDTYLALGSLFRSKGDVSRAIRIHQRIIHRPRLDSKTRIRALYDLGLDYRKAGLLDRAIATFQEVISRDNEMLQAYIQLEELYEEVKDWEAAFRAQERVSKLRKSDDRNVLAHLMTELGKMQLAQGDRKAARQSFRKAIGIDPGCVDVYLHLGDLHAEEGEDAKAVEMWKRVMEVSPSMTFLAYNRLEHAFFRMGKIQALEGFLREKEDQGDMGLYTRIFLAKHLRKKGELDEAGRTLRGVLDRWSRSREARQELIQVLIAQGRKDEALQEYDRLFHFLTVVDRQFQCRMCGYRNTQLFWKCPQCQRWDTMGSWEEGSPDGAQKD